MPRIAVASELEWPLRRHYDLVAGIEDFFEEQRSWHLDIGRYPESRIKRGRHYDGIVGRITEEILAAAREINCPVVNTWINSPVADQVPNVFVDARTSGSIAAEHLHGLGLTKLIHAGWEERKGAESHYEGFAESAAQLGCEVTRFCASPLFEYDTENWEQFVANLENRAKDWRPPVGIAVASDALARPIVSELTELGWEIPSQAAIVSVSNDLSYCNLAPSLSSIDLDYTANGREAARLLAKIMSGGSPPKETILVPPGGLIVRQTSGIAKEGTPPPPARLTNFH